MMQAIINYAWLELPRERPYSKKFGGKSTRLVCCYLPYPMSRSMTVRTYVRKTYPMQYIRSLKKQLGRRRRTEKITAYITATTTLAFGLACKQGTGVVQVQCKVDALVSFRSNGK